MTQTHPRLDVPRAPTRRGRVMNPARRLLVRLLGPMMSDFVIAHYELRTEHHALAEHVAERDRESSDAETVQLAAIAELGERIDDVNRRLDRLADDVAAASALAWDQVALARRLADIEDTLAVTPTPGTG